MRADSGERTRRVYASFADSIVLRGIRVDNPNGIADAWDQALSSDRPLILEAITDPDMPTLPPHITFKHARTFASALLKGDLHEAGIIKQSMKGLLEGVPPH